MVDNAFLWAPDPLINFKLSWQIVSLNIRVIHVRLKSFFATSTRRIRTHGPGLEEKSYQDNFSDFRLVEDHEDVGGSLQDPTRALDQLRPGRLRIRVDLQRVGRYLHRISLSYARDGCLWGLYWDLASIRRSLNSVRQLHLLSMNSSPVMSLRPCFNTDAFRVGKGSALEI